MPGIAWKRWHWLDNGLLPVAAAVMYAAWAYPLFAVHVRDPSTGVRHAGFTFWLCLGILLGGAAAGRIAGRLHRGAALVVGGGFAAILICLLLVAPSGLEGVGSWFAEDAFRPTAIAASVCALLLWWRGVRFDHVDHHEETSRVFVVGTLALAGLALMIRLSRGAASRQGLAYFLGLLLLVVAGGIVLRIIISVMLGRMDERVLASSSESLVVCTLLLFGASSPALPPAETLSGPILLFVSAGLVTRALLGVSWVLNNQRGRGGIRLHVDRNWLVVMLGAVAVVVFLGLVVGQVLTPRAVLSALGWLEPVWTVLGTVLSYAFFTAFWVAFNIIRFVLSRINLRLPEFALPPTRDLDRLGEGFSELSPIVRQGLNTALVLAVVALVAWILYRAARRLRWSASIGIDATENRGTVLTLKLLQSQLGRALDGLWQRVAPPFAGLGPPGDPRRAVRRAYQRILRRAMALGSPRQRGETPQGYVDTVADLCPEARSSIETLTSAYEIARYGMAPPTNEQVRAAQDASANVHTALRDRARDQEGQVDTPAPTR